MGRFENFMPWERGITRETMLFSESEFYDPGYTKEAQKARTKGHRKTDAESLHIR